MEWMRIVDAVSAGQTGIVIPIGTQAGSWKQFNKLCHRIEASEELNLDCKGTVWHASGTSVAAIARCEKSGLLDQRGRTIKLGSETFTAVTFHMEK
ncbi:MAG: hypothetical protein ACI4PV_07070 [Butyricicoccus sp.]